MKPGVDYIGVSVGISLVNEKGEIFLSKRGAQATNERGTWEKPGGKVQFGETLADAARREMKEEYGVDIELVYQFPAQNHLIHDEKQHWVPTIMEPDKCDAIGWFFLDKLPGPLSIITKMDIENYRKYLAHEDVNVV